MSRLFLSYCLSICPSARLSARLLVSVPLYLSVVSSLLHGPFACAVPFLRLSICSPADVLASLLSHEPASLPAFQPTCLPPFSFFYLLALLLACLPPSLPGRLFPSLPAGLLACLLTFLRPPPPLQPPCLQIDL